MVVRTHLLIMVVLILLLLLGCAAQHALQHLDQRLLPIVRRAGALDRRQRPCQARLWMWSTVRQPNLASQPPKCADSVRIERPRTAGMKDELEAPQKTAA